MNDLYAISSLELRNFRCFDDSQDNTLQFGSEVTVVIGKNGAGKTALLNAVKKSLSIILSRDRRRGVVYVGDGLNIRQNSLKTADARYHFDYSSSGEDYLFPVTLRAGGTVRGRAMDWTLEKESKGSRQSMTYREALDEFLRPFNDGTPYPKLPVLCFFSDCFPHVRNNISGYEKDILYHKPDNPERRAGYYGWDDDSTDFYFWTGLFVNAFRKINDAVHGLAATESLLRDEAGVRNREVLEGRMEGLLRARQEIEYVTRVMRQFSSAFSGGGNRDMEIESVGVGRILSGPGERPAESLKIYFTSGKCTYFEMLPEGYKRLFAIVFEIAYRHFVLNRSLVLDGECSPEGVVIIDELELHLHPTLAEEALSRLRRTFPGIQFIVTTHSPLVISNVHNDGQVVRVLRLDRDHRFRMADDCFQVPYGDTLVMAMGGYGNMGYMRELRQRYWTAADDGDEAGKEQVRAAVLDFVGNVSDAAAVADRILADWEAEM